MGVRACVCTYGWVRMRVQVCMHVWVGAHACAGVCMLTYVGVCAHMYAGMCACVHTCVCECTHVCFAIQHPY